MAKSERGLDRTKQGDSVTLRWPVRLGKALVAVSPAASAVVPPASAEPRVIMA